MARQKGIVTFTGSLGGLSFFSTKYGHFVRTPGGASKERIMNHPNMVRTRENSDEFKGTMKAVMHFKPVLWPFLKQFKDGGLHARMIRFFRAMVNFDTIHVRGQRSFGTAVQLPDGLKEFRGYVFTDAGSLLRLTGTPYRFHWGMDGVVWDAFSFSPRVFPAGATHLKLQASWVVYNPVLGEVVSKSVAEPVYLDAGFSGGVVLTPSVVPADNGLRVGLVFAQFVQEVNGSFYVFKEADKVVLEVGYAEFV